MAIWIDENACLKEVDQEKLYQYIWHLCNILAFKWKYFYDPRDYDEFALFAAGKVFERYTNTKLPKIKSSLNYIKKVLYPYKAQYQTQFYCENITEEKLGSYDTKYDPDLEWDLQDKCSGLNQSEFKIYLEDIAKTIKGIIERIPTKKNSSEWNRVYISCLLTFLDLITPETRQQARFEDLTKSDTVKTNFYKMMYKIPKNYKPILYHLDPMFSAYVLLLVKEARITIRNDLNDLLYSSVPTKDLYLDAVACIRGEDDNGEN